MKKKFIKYDSIVDKFSDNFEKNVKPYIKSQKTIENIYKSWDNEYVQSLDKTNLSNLIKSLSRLANIRIGSYLSSDYYKKTVESGITDSYLTPEIRPTPMAYRGLKEREGSIQKFDTSNLESLSLNKLRKMLSSVRQFVSEESSVLGDKTHGFYRIINERYKMFTKELKQEFGRNFNKYFEADYIKSESFSKLFWGVFNRLHDVRIAMKYDKDNFSSMLTEEIYPYIFNYASADKENRENIEKEIAQMFKEKYKGVYEEEQKYDIKNTLISAYNAGRNRR